MLRQDFNVPIINILWQLVAGYRFTEEHKHGLEVVEAVNTIFSTGMKTFFFPLWFLKVFHHIHVIFWFVFTQLLCSSFSQNIWVITER